MQLSTIRVRWPLCNGQSSRAPSLFGKVFPLCWRCTACIFGLAVASYINLSFSGWMGIAFTITAFVATAFDGYLSNYTKKGSTNLRRAASGLALGVAIYLFVEWFK